MAWMTAGEKRSLRSWHLLRGAGLLLRLSCRIPGISATRCASFSKKGEKQGTRGIRSERGTVNRPFSTTTCHIYYLSGKRSSCQGTWLWQQSGKAFRSEQTERSSKDTLLRSGSESGQARSRGSCPSWSLPAFLWGEDTRGVSGQFSA